MDKIKIKIKEFLARYFRTYEVKDDEDIFSLGYINSLFSMQLVLFIEKEFGISVTNEDLDIENFKTINNIVSFVSEKSVN